MAALAAAPASPERVDELVEKSWARPDAGEGLARVRTSLVGSVARGEAFEAVATARQRPFFLDLWTDLLEGLGRGEEKGEGDEGVDELLEALCEAEGASAEFDEAVEEVLWADADPLRLQRLLRVSAGVGACPEEVAMEEPPLLRHQWPSMPV